MDTFRLLSGAALLVAGRKMFWLFVGLIGFVAGLSVGPRFFPDAPTNSLILAAVFGLVGALLAVFLQQFAIAAAGFLAGGYIANSLLHIVSLPALQPGWQVYVIGGILGAILVIAVFDWALTILSALVGSALIVQAFHTNIWFDILLFIVLFCAGMMVQRGVKNLR
jgi:hypothetical protein